MFAIVSDPELPICHYFYLCHEWAGDMQNAEPPTYAELRWTGAMIYPKIVRYYLVMKELEGVCVSS
ncbi:hypothetical protein O9929_27155 [Vibrio lentus]|nr:hypothetical protein [Vibrio lentus]